MEAATASGFLVTSIEGVVSEHFRRVVGEKTRDALARLRAQGRRTSRFAPYGFRFGPGGQLLPDAAEQVALGAIAAHAGGGLSLRALSRTLEERGIVARSGRPFASHVLMRLVRDQARRPVSVADGSP